VRGTHPTNSDNIIFTEILSGGDMIRKMYLLVIIFQLCFCLNIGKAYSQDIPEFKVIGQYKTALSLLVPPSTKKDQLIKLVYAFKEAKQNNTLSKMIPPTTPGGIKGKYAIIQIFIFNEPKWATEEILKKYLGGDSPLVYSDGYKKKYERFVKQVTLHIRAYYWANPLGQEEGSIGTSTEIGGKKLITPNYKKLF
jgi:hypothetical protein